MRYKPLLLSSLGLISTGVPAADAASPTLHGNAQAAFAYSPTSWTGLYVGANLGGISDHSSESGFYPSGGFGSYCFGNNTFIGTAACNFANSQTATGVIGGLQIGYNFQTGNWVYGLETDFDFSSARKTTTGSSATGYAFGSWSAQNGVKEFGTARLRLGYAFDRALVFATGGLAYADMVNNFTPGNATGYTWTNSGTGWRTGYAVGGGLEYQLTDKISVKGEALYYDLGSVDHVISSSTGSFGLTDHMTGVIGRVGINYLFH